MFDNSSAATARRWALSAGLILLCLTAGCTSDPDSGQSGVSAEQVCDGSLDKEAAAALRRLSGSDRFKELTGTNDAGEPNKFSLGRAAQHLHDATAERSRCTVYKATDKSGIPLIQIDFKAADSYPRRQDTQGQEPRKVYYDLGVYASTAGEYSTTLYFRCRTTSRGKSADYVDAGISSVSGKLKGNSKSADRMTVLNAVSRRLAAELNCSASAGLPARIPAPDTR
ncbi:hypothetical protein [Streptomyces sp. SID8499]|uniref:hypothetical protein n=1 Tax=Streptomyces sp. SID8499 TaxID=2706106 RepID=UPI0013CC8D62|nr:hypothetical protein [Streptomyces sp. SID8499]NED37370.1 hypothetical protein [Streptomyces sp. SID8499]